MSFFKRNYPWVIVAVLAIAPLFIIASMLNISVNNGISVTVLTSKVVGDGKNSLEMLYHVSGEFAIRWMTAVLSCTPFFILFGITNLYVRQAMGIATAVWSLIHFIIFIAIEGFTETFCQVNYVAGFGAILILIPLLMTSNSRSMKWLKSRWKKLQRLAYVAIILSLIHVALLQKTWIVYAIIVLLGFGIRMPFIKEKIIAFRKRIINTKNI